MYPLRRNRRLRTSEAIRSLVRETLVSPNDFIVPLFVVEGKNVKEEIASMPNYYRLSLDLLQKEMVKKLQRYSLKHLNLLMQIHNLKKTRSNVLFIKMQHYSHSLLKYKELVETFQLLKFVV